MFLRFALRKKRGKREAAKPRFLVLRRRTLTVGAALLAALQPCGSVITVEEHNVNGGLGSLVAEVLAEAGVGIALQRLGIPDGEYAAAADRGWMRQYHGFDAAAIVALVQKRD